VILGIWFLHDASKIMGRDSKINKFIYTQERVY